MAFHLWKSAHLQKYDQRHQKIRKTKLFSATLKNPKTVLLAAGIFPVETWNSIENAVLVFAIFSVILIPVSIFGCTSDEHFWLGVSMELQPTIYIKGRQCYY
jgi:threonine/homoserine/homoserine lactone efflux protein